MDYAASCAGRNALHCGDNALAHAQVSDNSYQSTVEGWKHFFSKGCVEKLTTNKWIDRSPADMNDSAPPWRMWDTSAIPIVCACLLPTIGNPK
jgi:hypothetical protein